MRVPYNWLKEYVNLKLSPEKLAELLTMAGLSVESVDKRAGDHVLEIEITANRPDWLSMIGVAREVAALTGAKLIVPRTANVGDKGQGVRVSVEEKELCPRYTARVIRNVKVAESPAWLKARIEALGLRPVNNIVDITNFCLFETGEPMHAFDLDKLAGGQIAVRKARHGEKLVVIDGGEKSLDASVLVIADAEKPVAMAGVMGGLNTEVTAATKNILLEAAFFDPISIRRTSRKFAFSTESSYRFERRVDSGNIVYSSDRALGLILELAGGQAGAFVDVGRKEAKKKTVTVSLSRVNSLLGTAISAERVKKIVASLGMKVLSSSKETMKLEMPTFRNDLNVEVDIIEEVSRIYGYNNIPSTIPAVIEQPTRVERDLLLRTAARSTLAALGFDEIITYSLLSRKMAALAAAPEEHVASLENPLTSEQEIMRPSLVPGMLNALVWNINRKAKDLQLFEIGNTYYKKPGGGYAEELRLSMAMTGDVFTGWAGAPRQAGFFELKGAFEALLSALGVEGVRFAPARHAGFAAAECASLEIGGSAVGTIGLAASRVANGFDIKEKVYILETDLGKILKHAAPEKSFAELPKYPSVSRDISILAARATTNADIVRAVKEAAGPILKGVTLIDRYAGKQIPDDKVSLTYRLEYQDPARTLEEKDVLDAHNKVLRALEEGFGAKLR